MCRDTLVDKLVEECTNVIDENKIYNKTLSSDCTSCTLYVVLFAVFLTASIIISSAFIYFIGTKK